jgi:hypothetical protein
MVRGRRAARGLASVEKLTSVYSASRRPAVLGHFDHGEGGRRKEAVLIAISADLLAYFILLVRAAIFDFVGLSAHDGPMLARASARAAERRLRGGAPSANGQPFSGCRRLSRCDVQDKDGVPERISARA